MKTTMNLDWGVEYAGDDKFWHIETFSKAPVTISNKYQQLRTLLENQEYYGVFFAEKDMLEVIIKFYNLCCCGISIRQGSDNIIQILCKPDNSLSLGDWINTVTGGTVNYFGKNSELGAIMAKLRSFYNQKNIARWRNDTIGHGALAETKDIAFHQELIEKLQEIKQLLELVSCLYESFKFFYDATTRMEYNGQTYDLTNFIKMENGKVWMFDSIDRQNTVKEISYDLGRRRVADNKYFAGIRKKYFNTLKITGETPISARIQRKSEHAAMNAYYDEQNYYKQKYMLQWLQDAMGTCKKGIFLLNADRGTGKSTFAYMLDELGGAKLSIADTAVRTYYCNRTSIRNVEDFTSMISQMFLMTKDGNDFINQTQGGIPGIDWSQKNPKAAMVNLLSACQNLYSQIVGKDNILFIIDGIDELETEATGILNFIPKENQLPDNCYVLLTCRADTIPSPLLMSFVQQHTFTKTIVFDRRKECRDMLVDAVSDIMKKYGTEIQVEQAKQLADYIENRFTMLPVIKILAENHISIFGIKRREMYQLYFKRIKEIYGTQLFSKFIKILFVIADAPQPLTMKEAVYSATGEEFTLSALAMLYDLKPVIVTYRNLFGGLLLWTEDEALSELLSGEYAEIMGELAVRWQELILAYPDTLPFEQNGHAYICARLLPVMKKYGIVFSSPSRAEAVLQVMNSVAVVYGRQDYSYVYYRCMDIYHFIDAYLDWHSEKTIGVLHKDDIILNENVVSCMKQIVHANIMHSYFVSNNFTGLLKMEQELEKIKEPNLLLRYYSGFMIVYKTLGEKEKALFYDGKIEELLNQHSINPVDRKSTILNRINLLKDCEPHRCLAVIDREYQNPIMNQLDRAKMKASKGVALAVLRSMQLESGDVADAIAGEEIIAVLQEGLDDIADAALCPQNMDANFTQVILYQHQSKIYRMIFRNYDKALEANEKSLNIMRYHMSVGNLFDIHNLIGGLVEHSDILKQRQAAGDIKKAYVVAKEAVELLERTNARVHPALREKALGLYENISLTLSN